MKRVIFHRWYKLNNIKNYIFGKINYLNNTSNKCIKRFSLEGIENMNNSLGIIVI